MPLLLLAYPFLELWSLLELSAEAGALATIAYILLMIVLGYWLLQMAGRSALLTAGRFPSAAAIRGHLFAGEISVAFGAVLLMIPGLISDFLALYVFLRAALKAVLGGASSRGGPRATQPERDIPNQGPNRTSDTTSDRGPVTLEGDFSRVDDD
ncbi:MAG: FxsA family protein [Halieaceae bacterium]